MPDPDICNAGDDQLIEDAERTLEKIIDVCNIYLSAKTVNEAHSVLLRLRFRRLSLSLSKGPE